MASRERGRDGKGRVCDRRRAGADAGAAFVFRFRGRAAVVAAMFGSSRGDRTIVVSTRMPAQDIAIRAKKQEWQREDGNEPSRDS